MPYAAKTWVDNPAGGTPMQAADLNHLERGLAAAYTSYNVQDPAYAGGAKGDGVTIDRAAIQAAIDAAKVVGGTVLFPTGQYVIDAPLEVTGLTPLLGIDPRTSVIIASSSFSGNQMVRNWVSADWAVGETDHRVAPANPTLSGTHAVEPYARISNLGFNAGGVLNLACLSWAGPNETTILRNLVLASGISTTANRGIWGIDLQGNLIGPKLEDIVFYGTGWERQLSFDSSTGSGANVYCDTITFSPSKLYHSMLYVNNVDDFVLREYHLETAAGFDAAAHAYIYLVTHTGFGSYSFRDGHMMQNASTSKPFLLQDNDQAGNLTRVTAPLIDRLKIQKTAGAWTGNFLSDQYHDVALGTMEVIHRYDGQSITYSNADGSLRTNRFGSPFNVKDYGATGNGTTDDRAAIQSAINAAGAVGGTVFSPPGYTYLVSSGVMTIAATCKMDFSGSTIKKANGWSVGGTYSIIDVTAANVEIRNLVLDGNAAGAAKGYGITWPGTNGRAENVVTQNIAWAGGPGTGVSWAIASVGFVGRDCKALAMSDTGLGFSIGADDVTLLDCHVVGLGDAGGTYAGFYVGAGVDRFTLSGTAARCSFGLMAPGGGPCQDWNVLAFSGIDNGNTSVYLSEVNESHFGPLVSFRPGQVDGYPSGNGIEMFSCNDSTFVSLHCTHPTGYAAALVLSAHNTLGIITGHLYGADPCVSVQSSHHNTINEIHAHNASFGLSLGAEDDGGNGPANHNHVGTVVAVECAFAAALIGGTGNTVGRVISRETFTYDSHIYALGVVEFEADANWCRVDSLDHYNAGAAPSGFDAVPLNLVNFRAGSQDCLLLNARSPAGHYANIQTDAGTGNGVVLI